MRQHGGAFPGVGQGLVQGRAGNGAVVYFHREGGGGAKDQPIPYGIVEEDGSFELNSDDLGCGCAARATIRYWSSGGMRRATA